MNTIKIEVIKYSYRQSKDGHIVGFVIHPNDVNNELLKAPIGQQYQIELIEVE